MYLSDMSPAMKPSDAYAKLVHREVERVPIDNLEGRVTSILLIPGERFNKTIVDYLKFARDFNSRFPGFDTDVHGLIRIENDGKTEYFVDCVKTECVNSAFQNHMDSCR